VVFSSRAGFAFGRIDRRQGGNVDEIIRTHDPVLVSAVEALLAGEGVTVFVADRHVSALEARIAAFPLRVLVPSDEADRARRLIREAGWGADLRGTDP
jgi:hypothetical protein